jgi:signal transduction histidine kinase/ActR/RegA family two-component response regulator
MKPRSVAAGFDDRPESLMSLFVARRTFGIQARLVMLAVVTAMPLLALASFAVLRTVDDQRAQIKQDVSHSAENLLEDVDRQISAIQAELQVLAISPSLQDGDFAAFDRQMRAALTIRGTSIVLHDTKGQQLLSTNRPFGEPLPRATNTQMHDRVVETGQPQISDLIMGAVLRRPIIVLGVPVFRDGKVVYVLAMGLGSEVLSSLLQEQKLSPDWIVGIFDRKGIIVARDRELDRFLGKSVSPTLLEAMRGPVENWFPSVTSEGIPVYAAFRRSPITGWTVAIGLPRELVDAPLRRARLLAFGGGAAVLALSLALGWWMARAIRRPVEALTAATKALGRGERIDSLSCGVRELDEVGNELRNTSAALASNREQLETTVVERTRELATANDRLRAEIDAREQAQSALLQAQKMEAMGQLTGGVAHDFNNLLTAVSGSLALLEPRISDEKGLRLLHTAQRGASQGAKLTESLLAFARQQRLNPIPAELNSIILEMTELLQRSIGPTIEIRHDLASDLWPVLIDTGQIETALLNIALNARDAMLGGGMVLIETANIRAGNTELPVENAGQDCVLVSVRDTGTGMSPEVLARVFDPFFTTKEVGKGTGLGLSMVFGVVRQSGGSVRIHSRLREGTTVRIYLPRAVEAATSGRGRRRLACTAEGAHILVVDDDPDVRWIIAQDLEEIGYVVTEADSGRAALTMLERDAPCDLMVADLVMPGLSGLDTLRLARRTRPDLKVLFASGYADLSRFGSDLGNHALLKKPFKLETLAQAVQTALQRVSSDEPDNVVPLRRDQP